MAKEHPKFDAAMLRLERFPPFRSLERLIYRGACKIAPLIVWFASHREVKEAKSKAEPRPTQRWVRNQHHAGGRVTVTVFLLFLTLMTILSFCMPLRPTRSDLEQRDLTAFPTASVQTVLSGEYFDGINTWFADTFPFREHLLKFQSELEELYGFRGKKISGPVTIGDEIPDAPAELPDESEEGGADASASAASGTEGDTSRQVESQQEDEQPQKEEKPEKDSSDKDQKSEEETDIPSETLGALLVRGNAAYEYYNFVKEDADTYISLLNKTAKNLKGKAKVYDLIIPTSMDICVPERVRKDLNTSDQKAAIQYLLSSMSEDVTTINIFETMQEHQDAGEYLYFRTDHHWTALGAYHAYEKFADAAGKKTANLEQDFKEHVYDGFLGSFYRDTMSSTLASKPDTVYAYEPKDVNNATITWKNGKTSDYAVITDVTDWESTSKYNTFIGSDNPFTVIENPEIKDGSSILLIKESFGNCFAPFLTESYQTVYVVDYRYFHRVDDRSLEKLVEDYGIQDVLFLNNISATRDEAVDQIKAFVNQ